MVIDIANMLATKIGNNTGSEYLFAGVVFAGIFVMLRFFKTVVLNRLKELAKTTKTKIDDLLVAAIDKLHWSLYVFVSTYFALGFLRLPTIVQTTAQYAAMVLAVYYVTSVLQQIIGRRVDMAIQTRKERNEDISLLPVLGQFANYILWLVAVLFVLSNLGINVTSIIAGLGIGGIAVALALQSTFKDLFCSFAIFFDKPFAVGDFIILGNDKGTVRKIGLRSTRLSTLQGEELIISNQELTSTRIQNFKKMERRRICFNFGVTYDTSVEKLKKIPGIVKKILAEQDVDIDRVHFQRFGDFSLIFEVVYYVKVPDYVKYMDTQQAINLGIKEAFEKETIKMAFPTQTIILGK